MNLLKECKAGLIISAAVLLVPILHVVGCITYSRIIIGDFFIGFPIVVFVLCSLFSLIRKIPDGVRIGVVSLITVLTIAFCGVFSMFGNIVFETHQGEDAALRYEDYCEYIGIDAKLCGDYEDIKAYRYEVNTIFPSNGDTYILKYNDADFEEAKEIINTTVKFYKEPLEWEGPMPEFTVDGFDFRVMVTEMDYYPKWMYFIGINDFSKEIAFVDFSMPDLDSISDFADTIMYSAGWYYISEERAD